MEEKMEQVQSQQGAVPEPAQAQAAEAVAEPVKAMSQKEIDRIVQKRLSAEKAKWEQESQKAAQRAKMSAEQRAQEELKEKAAEIQRLQAQNNAILMKQEAVNLLAGKGLPAQFADFLTGESSEVTAERVAAFESAFRQAVGAQVSEQIKGKPPERGASTSVTREQFNRMTYGDLVKLQQEHPKLYQELSKKG